MLGRRGFFTLSAAGVLCLVAPEVRASLARGASLADLTRRSRHALIGQALAAECRWEYVGPKKRIVTYTRVRVDEPLGGDSTDSELWVRTLGGKVGKTGQIVHGEAMLLLGERTLLFLASSKDGALEVTEMAQGHFPIRADASGTERLVPSPRLSELRDAENSAVRALVGKIVPDASSVVRKAWRDAH
jgi:hypothetical protein